MAARLQCLVQGGDKAEIAANGARVESYRVNAGVARLYRGDVLPLVAPAVEHL